MNAQKSLSRISADKALWIAQWKQESFDRDIRSGLHAAERRGIQQGLQQGLQQGAKANALSNAKNLLTMHILTVEQIAQACGLSVEEVQELQK